MQHRLHRLQFWQIVEHFVLKSNGLNQLEYILYDRYEQEASRLSATEDRNKTSKIFRLILKKGSNYVT